MSNDAPLESPGENRGELSEKTTRETPGQTPDTPRPGAQAPSASPASPSTPSPASPRGDETRDQLLETGTRLFAIYGYDSVSTRQIATEAGANVAAISYHFGGKRELYRAVLQKLVEDTGAIVEPGVAVLFQGLKSAGNNKQKLAGIVARFVENIITLFLQDEFMKWRGPLVMREYALPSEDYTILYDGRLAPMHTLITRMAAQVLEKDPDDPECAIRAHAIMGQVLVFGIARELLWRRLDWDGYTPERVAQISEVAKASVLSSLNLPQPPPLADNTQLEGGAS